jgi:hypothetical protein
MRTLSDERLGTQNQRSSAGLGILWIEVQEMGLSAYPFNSFVHGSTSGSLLDIPGPLPKTGVLSFDVCHFSFSRMLPFEPPLEMWRTTSLQASHLGRIPKLYYQQEVRTRPS